jgi:fluoroquinolone resistance protein
VSASFKSCKLTGADLSEAKAMDVSFVETLLINAKLPSHSFRKLTLHKIDFSQADLRNCDFRAAVFEDCSLRDAHMAGSRFEGADLRGADLGGLRLMDAALFRGATISRQQAGQLLGELGLNVR